jgi:hypothetical protein
MVATVGLVMLTSGCSTVYRIGANVGLRFTEDHVIPPILSDDDVQMACINGQALAPVIYAVGPAGGTGIGADNDQLSVLLYSTAALCAEQTALDNELRYLRASRANQVEEAQDARIAQKRWAELASRRQYTAYQHFEHFYEKKYDLKIGEKCPKFKSDFDEMVFLLGSISGIQAVVNDINSQNAVGVPKDIAAKVERSMKCLDSDKWWGVPIGVRAAVWNLLPGAGAGQDPWETLKGSMRVGERKGVRLSHALYAMSAYAKADDARLRDALKIYAATNDNQDFHIDPHFKMFDKFGELVIMGISDRYWTEHTGSRTPAGSVGKFWDDKPTLDQGGGVQIDDLL